MTTNATMKALGRRLRLAVVGGSYGFIGPVHRVASRIDDRYEIVAGVLSSDAARGAAAAKDIGIDSARAYASVQDMLAAERLRADGAEVVAIMTPNAYHYEACVLSLQAGLHVICDKPLTTNLDDALRLAELVKKSGLVFCLTHNYTGYAMVRQARAMVQAGEIGEIRQIHLNYVQGYFATLVEADSANPGWRFDQMPDWSLVMGDIGTHAHHLGAFVSGLELTSLMADIGPTMEGRAVDDYGGLLLRWSNGARGTMWVTNSAAGSEHGLSFRIYGSKGGLEWHQEYPNELKHRQLNGFEVVQTRRLGGALHPHAEHATRVEIGHPEGYQEAFATLYRDAADAITAHITGVETRALPYEFPTVIDGVKGVKLIASAVQSMKQQAWVNCSL
ncbi:Gfo/Idh/MocA family protein [Rhodoferax lacus]|nr:Gfo/Idh/MocA family oxidoreductase [Rhodoferax lacus]